jgi:hypothetical protein
MKKYFDFISTIYCHDACYSIGRYRHFVARYRPPAPSLNKEGVGGGCSHRVYSIEKCYIINSSFFYSVPTETVHHL